MTKQDGLMVASVLRAHYLQILDIECEESVNRHLTTFVLLMMDMIEVLSKRIKGFDDDKFIRMVYFG